MKRCFLIGHRDAPFEIEEKLKLAVERHICEHGIREFMVGGYGRFDGIAATRGLKSTSQRPAAMENTTVPRTKPAYANSGKNVGTSA